MGTIVAIHQPNFLPWTGYFYKIIKSDIFVLLDDVQYIKRSFTNRNKIKTPHGEKYINLPIYQKGKYKQLIIDCKLFDKEKSVKTLTSSIRVNYGRAKYFKNYIDDFESILNENTDSLVDINILFIKWIAEIMEIPAVFKRSSELQNINGLSTERLISICKSVDADEYFSEVGGNKYQDENMFREFNIELMISNFESPCYDQLWGEFIPNLSIIDLIFNCGPNSKKYILGEQ